jgi:hypothetical protein
MYNSELNYHLTDGDLVVKRVKTDSAGVYECTAKNTKGSATSQGYLKVVTMTTIEIGPADMTVRVEEEKVEMKCKVIWDPSFVLEVKWMKDGKDVFPAGRFNIDRQSNSLIIRDLNLEDEGRRRCKRTTNNECDKQFLILSKNML